MATLDKIVKSYTVMESYLSDSVCNNKNGTCSSFNNCSCSQSWSGSDCEIALCFGTHSNDGSVCSGRGIYVLPELYQ